MPALPLLQCVLIQCQAKKERELHGDARHAREGKGAATHWGSYRIPVRQNSHQPVSSSDESAQGTPDRSGSPVSMSSSTHRDLEVELALMDSPARESEPHASLSPIQCQTAQPTPSPPNGSLSGLGGKAGTSSTPPQATQDLPNIASALLGGGVWTRRGWRWL